MPSTVTNSADVQPSRAPYARSRHANTPASVVLRLPPRLPQHRQNVRDSCAAEARLTQKRPRVRAAQRDRARCRQRRRSCRAAAGYRPAPPAARVCARCVPWRIVLRKRAGAPQRPELRFEIQGSQARRVQCVRAVRSRDAGPCAVLTKDVRFARRCTLTSPTRARLPTARHAPSRRLGETARRPSAAGSTSS
jgi:hypothetical protein